MVATLSSLISFTAGCDNNRIPTAPVTGRVTYRGKVLQSGAVLFQPEAGPSATGTIQPDGSFRLSTYAENDGAVLGVHKVAITCFANDTANQSERRSQEPGLGKALIPQKYLNYQSSGLTAEVDDSTNHFGFELK